jgi:hypothetical protein
VKQQLQTSHDLAQFHFGGGLAIQYHHHNRLCS